MKQPQPWKELLEQSHKVLGNRRKTIEGMKTRIKKKKTHRSEDPIAESTEDELCRKHSKDMDNRTRELQPHKSEMDHLKCLEIRWETEKIGIEIFKTHIIRTLAAGKYTRKEQLLKDLFKKL